MRCWYHFCMSKDVYVKHRRIQFTNSDRITKFLIRIFYLNQIWIGRCKQHIDLDDTRFNEDDYERVFITEGNEKK